MDEKIKEVMGLVSLLEHNASIGDDDGVVKLRQKIETKLSELVPSPKINGYESGMQSRSKVTLWFESPGAAEAWFDNFMENFKV